MIDKQEILTILDYLAPSWPFAKGIKVLLNRGKLDDTKINQLLAIFKNAIKKETDREIKEKFQNSINSIKKIKNLEKSESIKDNENIEKLIPNF